MGICTDGAEELRWLWNRPPSRPCLLVSLELAPPPNRFALVALLAFFSRSFIFFINCFASFSSTKDSPAKQSSVSNV